MTPAYDAELLRVALEAVESAAADLARHDLPDWMQHRIAHIRAEAKSLAQQLETACVTYTGGKA